MPKKTKRKPTVSIGVTDEHYDFIERNRGRKSQASFMSEVIAFYFKAKNIKL
jgi:hypothetical protein